VVNEKRSNFAFVITYMGCIPILDEFAGLCEQSNIFNVYFELNNAIFTGKEENSYSYNVVFHVCFCIVVAP
jgi:hypothetical protein